MDSHHRQSSNQGGGDRPPNTDHWHSRVPRPLVVNHRGNRHYSNHRQWSAYTPYRHSIQPDQSHGSRRQPTRNQYTPRATQPPRAQAGQSSTNTQSSNLIQCTPSATQPPRAQAGQSSTSTTSATLPHRAGLPLPRAQAGQKSTSTLSFFLPQSTHRAAQPSRVQACQPSTSTQSSIQQAVPKPHSQSALAQSHQVKQSQSHASNAPCSGNSVKKVPSKRKSLMPNVVNQKKFCIYRQRSEVTKRLKLCTVHPEQLEYAEYTEELDMNLTLKASDSDYKIQMYDLSCTVCAFINTSGGLVLIKPITPYRAKDLENFKNNIKQTLKSFLGKMVKSCIKIEPKMDDKDRLRIYVSKGSSVTNVHSNFYVRDDCITTEIKKLDEIKNVLNHHHGPVPYDAPTAIKRWKGLKYEERIQIHESKTLEYKCYRECETVEDLLEKMTNNTAVEKTLFAFANQPAGGELIIGIRDDNKTGDKQVIGQKLPDEATFRNKFATFMAEGNDGRERIWGKIGHKPQDGREWSINIIPVDDVPKNERRVLIHICVNYFPGGVFAACPEAYTVLPDGDVEGLDYKAWCDLVFSPEDSSVPAAPAVSQSIPETSTEKDVELGEDTQSSLANELKQFTEENDKRSPPSISWTRYSEIWERDKQKLQIENDDMQIDMLQYSSLLTLQTPLDFFPPRKHLLANDTDGKIANSLEEICKYYRTTPAVAFGGFSISSLFPTVFISPPSTSHVMDLCVLRSDGIDLWTIAEDTTSSDNHSTYLISVMRRLKRILLSECHAEVSIKGFVKILGQSEIAIERQTMPGNNENKLDYRKAFSDLLKNGNAWMKNRFGEDILVMLTRAQMEIILASGLAQFSIIDGPPGSGKTLMAFHLIQNLKQTHGLKSHQIKYICPNIALANYAKSQNLCQVGVSTGDHEMLEMLQQDISEGIQHFVFDDQHKIICETNEWTEMCDILTIQEREHKIKIHMTIFRDSAFQHYGDEESTFMKAINKYKEKHDTFPLLINSHLYEMLRNCGKIFSFFKANAGEDEGKLQCKYGVMGDDVGIHSHTYEEMLSRNNPATAILKEILQGDHHGHFFQRNDVAMLLDLDEKEKESIERNLRSSIQEEFGTDSVQDASKFPVTDIILDSLQNFSGLDAKACILIVKDQNINKNRYKMYAASRGILRVDFLLLKKLDWSGVEAVTKKMHVSDNQIWKQRTNQLHQQLRLHLQNHSTEPGCQDWINNHVPTQHAWSQHLGSLSAVHKGSLKSVPVERKITADFLVGYLSRVISVYHKQENLNQVLESGLKHTISGVEDETRMLHVINGITCHDPTAESKIFEVLLSEGLFTALAFVVLKDQLSSEGDGGLSQEVLSVINKHCSDHNLGQQLLDEVGKKSNRQLFLWMKTFLPEQLHSKLFLQICAKNLQTTGSNLIESIESCQWPSVKYLELLNLGQDAISCDSSPAVIVDSLNLIHLGVTKLQHQTYFEIDQHKLKQCMESLIQVLDKYKDNAEVLENVLETLQVVMKKSGEARQAAVDQGLIPVLLHLLQHHTDTRIAWRVGEILGSVIADNKELAKEIIKQLLDFLQQSALNVKILGNVLETLKEVMKKSGEARQAAVDQGLIPVLLHLLQQLGTIYWIAWRVGEILDSVIANNKELAKEIIKQLLDFLQQSALNETMIVNVLETLQEVMKKSREAKQAAVDQGLIPVLLQLLQQSDTDYRIAWDVGFTLGSVIADNKELAEKIIKQLLDSLQQSAQNEEVLENVLGTLQGVMRKSGEARQAAVDQGLIPVLLQLLQKHHTDTRILLNVLRTLQEVVKENGDARQAAVDQGLIPVLIHLLQKHHTDFKVAWFVGRTLLSVIADNKELAEKIIKQLLDSLQQSAQNEKILNNVLKALQGVMEKSGEARQAAVDQGLIPVLLQLLQHDHTGTMIAWHVGEILGNVITDNKELAEMIIKQLLDSLQQSAQNEEILRNVLRALQEVMKKSGEARQAAVDQGLIPVLLHQLQQAGTDSSFVYRAADILEILAKHSLIQLNNIQRVASVLTSIKDKSWPKSDLWGTDAEESINKALLTIRETYDLTAAASSTG